MVNVRDVVKEEGEKGGWGEKGSDGGKDKGKHEGVSEWLGGAKCLLLLYLLIALLKVDL